MDTPMKISYAFLFVIMLLFSTNSSSKCQSRSEALMNAVLLEEQYPEYFDLKKLKEDSLSQVTSYSQLGRVVKRIDFFERQMKRSEKRVNSCFSDKANKYYVDRIAGYEIYGKGGANAPHSSKKKNRHKMEKWQFWTTSSE